MKKIKNRVFLRRIMKKMRFGKKTFVLLLIFMVGGGFSFFHYARAAALTTLSDVMSNLNDGEASNHDIRFRTPSGMSSSTLKIYFNSAGFSSGSVDYTDIDLQYGSSQSEVNGSCSSNCTKATLAATAGAGTWGAAFSSNDLTFTYPTSGGTAIAANDYVRVLIGTNATHQTTGDQQMTNPGTTGTKVITIEVAGTTDTGKLAVVIVSDDQVAVTTTIDPYITFTLNDNTVSLVTSSDGNPSYNATGYNKNDNNTLSVATNGTSGYTLSYTGSTLTSGSNTITAIGGTPAVSTTNTEQFGINLRDNSTPDVGADPSGSGSGTPASDYNTPNQFAFEPGSTPITLASASTATASNTFTISYIVNVSETTESGAYGTTITYIATGNF